MKQIHKLLWAILGIFLGFALMWGSIDGMFLSVNFHNIVSACITFVAGMGLVSFGTDVVTGIL